MAWSKDCAALHKAIGTDIDGFWELGPILQHAILEWILEDRKRSPDRKAEKIMARRNKVR